MGGHGVGLLGSSAGGICWFEGGTTDLFGPELRAFTDGLGMLPGSYCPHYESEARRAKFVRCLRVRGRIVAKVRSRRDVMHMITVGSVSRDTAADRFAFLRARYRGRRGAIKEFTHAAPEFVFWIYPDGTLFNAKDAHRRNVPRGYDFILDDEPDYGGFLRGRLARSIDGWQLLVVYCREEALTIAGPSLAQLLAGLAQMPVPVDSHALVVSDNADIYGTLADLHERQASTAA